MLRRETDETRSLDIHIHVTAQNEFVKRGTEFAYLDEYSFCERRFATMK